MKHQGIVSKAVAVATIASLGLAGCLGDGAGSGASLDSAEGQATATQGQNTTAAQAAATQAGNSQATNPSVASQASVAIEVQPVAAHVVAGAGATFSVVAKASGTLGYQWQRNGSDIPGATGPSYTLAAAQVSDNGADFTVVVRSATASVTSQHATLYVSAVSAAPTAASRLNDTGLTFGANATASNNAACIGETVAQQDCAQGRDALAAQGALSKVGFGRAGFDWTKLDAAGNPLPSSAGTWSCIRDNVTGLIWEVKTRDGGLRDTGHMYTYFADNRAGDASAFVAAVNAQGLCGASDWRLPSVIELQGLQDYSVARPGPMIDTTAFPNTAQNWYWAADATAASPTTKAWDVDFYEGYVNMGYFRTIAHSDGSPSDGGRVRLVRGSSVSGNGRFSVALDNGEWVVRDSATGLTWRHCPEGMTSNGSTCNGGATSLNWAQALARGSIQATPPGRNAWRVPDAKELSSILDRTRISPASFVDSFPNTPSADFWTSTVPADDVGDARYFQLVNGNAYHAPRTQGMYIRLVRTGQ